MGDLRLVRPKKKHERQAMEYLKEFDARGSELHGVGGLDRYKDDYDGWLEKLVVDRVQVPNSGHKSVSGVEVLSKPRDQSCAAGL